MALRMQVSKPKKICSKCVKEFEDTAVGGRKELICTRCSNKRAQLSKMFGKWPIPIFEELSDQLQVSFWAQDSKAKSKINDDLVVHLTQTRVNLEREKVGGKYLPESVYAAQGYKTDMIRKNCSSKWDDQLEEKTYRLVTFEIIEEKVKKDVVALLNNVRNTNLTGKLSHYASPHGKRKHRKRKRSSSQSDSSSKSSSSSKASASPIEPTPQEIAARAKAEKAAAAAAAKKAEKEEKLKQAAVAAAEKTKAAAEKVRAKEELIAQKQLDKVAQKEKLTREKAEKFAAKLANNAFDMLREPLTFFQDAMKESPPVDDYTKQTCELLLAKVKAILEESGKAIASGLTDPLSFDLKVVRSLQFDVVAKTKKLKAEMTV
jgi:hypothetical protein